MSGHSAQTGELVHRQHTAQLINSVRMVCVLVLGLLKGRA